MDEKIVAIYCLCDDFLKTQRHQEDPQQRMSDAEVMTTAVVAARYFGGNHEKARAMLDDPRYIPRMLSKSRFCRRLHSLAPLFEALLNRLAERFKRQNASGEMENVYLADSFPVPVCDNIRISRSRLYPLRDRPPSLREAWWAELCEEPPPTGRSKAPANYRGYIASKRRYFYGVRLHLVTTETGQPVECVIAPGSYADVSMFPDFRLDLPKGSRIYTDKAFNDYEEEDFLRETAEIHLCPLRKINSRRPVPGYVEYVRRYMRKAIETTMSVCQQAFPKSIHAVIPEGFELKVFLFVLAHSISFVI